MNKYIDKPELCNQKHRSMTTNTTKELQMEYYISSSIPVHMYIKRPAIWFLYESTDKEFIKAYTDTEITYEVIGNKSQMAVIEARARSLGIF